MATAIANKVTIDAPVISRERAIERVPMCQLVSQSLEGEPLAVNVPIPLTISGGGRLEMVYIISGFLILVMERSNAEGESTVAEIENQTAFLRTMARIVGVIHRACDQQRGLWPNVLWRERPRHWSRANSFEGRDDLL